MRRYEMVLVAAPTVPEEDHDQQVTTFEQLIAERGGTVLKVDRWGRRKLAFPIDKFQEGNYTLVLYDAEPEVEKEFVRRVKLTDTLLRYLSVRADHEKVPTAEEKVALEEARREHLRRAAERAALGEAAEALAPVDEVVLGGETEVARFDEDAFEDDDWDGGPRRNREDLP
ncbi:MAG: 30S ribosomal protein S6 [Acidobacteria bacterium]|jgi:small subunit ribosomal protein S6|nr:30S ribosomal protein S6 [Acidobacteriota bacterium]